MVETAMLLGSDYAELGEVGVAELGPAIGLAISRGRFPKSYSHVDPNEDAVFAAQMGAVSILFVADGHNGFAAARSSIEVISASIDDIIRRALRDQEDAVGFAIGLIEAEVIALEGSSGVALSIAVVRGTSGIAATIGDTVIVAVGPKNALRIGGTTDFLRSASKPPSPHWGRISLGASDSLILVSDGVTDFAGRHPIRSLADATVGRSAASAARSLIDLGFSGGAGDNLATVVLAPPSAQP